MNSDVQGLSDVEPDLEDRLRIHHALCHARALVLLSLKSPALVR